MEKILVPADGSASCANAVSFAIDLARRTPQSQVFVINVQEPAPPEVMLEAGIAPETWQASYQEAGRKALEPACKLLDAAGIAYTANVAVGHPVTEIASRAQALNCTRIVMGTRGMGALGNLVLGSVATRVVHAVACPVTLVK